MLCQGPRHIAHHVGWPTMSIVIVTLFCQRKCRHCRVMCWACQHTTNVGRPTSIISHYFDVLLVGQHVDPCMKPCHTFGWCRLLVLLVSQPTLSVAKMTTNIALHSPNQNLLHNYIFYSTTIATLTVSLFQETEVQFHWSILVVNFIDYSVALSSCQ